MSKEWVKKQLETNWLTLTILACGSGGGGVIWKYVPGVKGVLSTPVSVPFWLWLIVGGCVIYLSIVLLRPIISRKKPDADRIVPMEILLTNPGVIRNKLLWWLGQKRESMYNHVDNQPIHWDFHEIDKHCGLLPGSSRKYLPDLLASNEGPLPVVVLNVCAEYMELKYDYSF